MMSAPEVDLACKKNKIIAVVPKIDNKSTKGQQKIQMGKFLRSHNQLKRNQWKLKPNLKVIGYIESDSDQQEDVEMSYAAEDEATRGFNPRKTRQSEAI